MAPAVDGAFARWLADGAGNMLRGLRDDVGFDDPVALRHAGDKQSHDFIATQLAKWRPGDAVLSEEAEHDDPARLTAERVWIVDPLDGTREYGEPGRTDWAVHIGLWVRSSTAPYGLAAAAIALPGQQRILATDFPPTYPPLSDQAASGGPLRIVVSRSRPPALATVVAAELGAELVPLGSAGAKVAAVISGDADAYLHAGGQYEWDSAAPVAVALATGMHASRIDGSPLAYNQPDPLLPDLVVCRKDLASLLLEAISRVG
ncbi:MAG TPA: 3'(2'),5'-bisphosphate nucleotidase CysQ [Micromonosporaceae bacterium]|jgi:3'(2'), 5'-bisphosphate nucleotidase|nr:3'(2'),5'-bisphosphate nucleotidase CysQ [Micromonosporaceae bacterium]